ncbi:MAG TPA: NAD(P)H-dependent oxidoreductase [Edaphocola sp.]|nr:NAD(P)H-dependent oxidoreductase [Edaphocola sp.]
MKNYKIAVLVGSLRKASWNMKIARTMMNLAPGTLELEIVPIGDLALYNEDMEADPPAAWTNFRVRMASFDGLLFVTPEYNRSVPAVLKNALDVGSRPYGKSCWNGKPAAIVSVSPGSLGAFGANHHLRQSLVFLNVPVMQQPEAYIGGVASLFDANGNLINESTKEFLAKFLKTFARWTAINVGK